MIIAAIWTIAIIAPIIIVTLFIDDSDLPPFC
jgi:hypothetical protein